MAKEFEKISEGHVSPFERIRKVNEAGNEYWESRDLAEILEYTQYRNFEAVIEKAKLACFNSGHRIEDHFADVSKMVGIGSGANREIEIALLSRYACYLAIQNADPNKEIVAQPYASGGWREGAANHPGTGRHDAGSVASCGKHQEDRDPTAQTTRGKLIQAALVSCRGGCRWAAS